MVHRVDDRAGTEEQHRLEECVRQQVEHRDRIDADTSGNEHIAKLRTGRIGDHALDVVLHQADGGSKESSCRAEEDDKRLASGANSNSGRHAADQENASCNHGRRVDQRRNRCRPLHRVRQPGVQEQLRRFAHRADEQQEGKQICRVPLCPEEADLRLASVGAAAKMSSRLTLSTDRQRENTQRKPKVADTVDHKSLDRCGIGARLTIVKTR